MNMNFIYDQCPACGRIGKSLACSKCMKNQEKGFLVLQKGVLHTKETKLASIMFIPKILEEKLKNVQNCMKDHKKYRSRSSKQIDALSRHTKINSEIAHYTKSIEALKRTLAIQRLELQNHKRVLTANREISHETQKRTSKILQKKMKLKEYIKNKQNSIAISVKKCESLSEDTMRRKKDHVTMLTEYIFPIKEVKLNELSSSLESEFLPGQDLEISTAIGHSSMQKELDEAQKCLFIDGRWVDQPIAYGDFVQMSVGDDAASAPLDGDYSLYVAWLEANHKSAGSDPPPSGGSMSMSQSLDAGYHKSTHKSVLRIGVALCHTAQMLLVIRKILGIHLPHKINYRTFCNPTISPHQFLNSVKLLNSNLLNICLRQGVDGMALHPLCTLINLQTLTNKLLRDGERKVPILPSTNILLSMEETLGLTDVSDDDSDPDAESLDWQLPLESDWEPASTGDSKYSLPPSSPTYTSTNTQSSMLSQPAGLVTSALNWATKGWWGTDQ